MGHLGYDLNNILVTGAQGFLGREILIKSKGLDSKFYFTGLRDEDRIIKCDLTLLNDVQQLSKDIMPSCIIHCAAHVPKTLDEYNDSNASEKNFTMLDNLISVFSCPIIFISSMTVYGDKDGKPVNENDTLKPTSIYGMGKKKAEKLLLKSDSPCLSVRIPGLYGNQRKSGLVYNIVQSLKNNTELKLPQKPLLWAAMDVEDAAKVILQLCNLDWLGINAVNVSYPSKYSINKLVYLVTKILDKNINYTVEHPIFQYDLSLLKQIGIDINTPFENSLKLFVDKFV